MSQNYFQLFSLPQNFAINLELLEEKYFAFQKRFHPDRAGIAEIENSILINQAYEVLKNPLSRAAHILQLNGIDVEKDETAPKPDIATLEEVLEIQEKIPLLDNEKILELKKDLQKKKSFLIDEIAKSLESQDFAIAAQILIKAKYFDKIF